jgi:hypothetical protein
MLVLVLHERKRRGKRIALLKIMIEISVTYSQRVDTMIGLSDIFAFLHTTFVKLYVENESICLISDAEGSRCRNA